MATPTKAQLGTARDFLIRADRRINGAAKAARTPKVPPGTRLIDLNVRRNTSVHGEWVEVLDQDALEATAWPRRGLTSPGRRRTAAVFGPARRAGLGTRFHCFYKGTVRRQAACGPLPPAVSSMPTSPS